MVKESIQEETTATITHLFLSEGSPKEQQSTSNLNLDSSLFIVNY